MNEKKSIGRSIVITLGIICMILTVGLVVLVVNYELVMSEKNATISSQDSQITNLQSWLDGNKTYYEDQLVNESRQIADRDGVIADLNNTIVSLNSEISYLASLLERALYYATVSELSLNASTWVNKTIMVEGNLTFIGQSRSIEDIANGYFWNYEISSNGTFGLNWAPDKWDNPSYDGVTAIVIGVLKATTVYSRPSYLTAYYIEAEKIVPL